MLTRRRLLIAVALATTVCLPGIAAAASIPLPAAGENQSNPPIVVHRALPKADTAPAGSVRAVLAVALGRTGHIRSVTLENSSGSPRFDRAALTAATETSFAPAARGCVARDATFLYAVARDGSETLTTAVIGREGSIRSSRRA